MLLFPGLSVCHVRALCSNGRRYRHDFFGTRQPHVSSRSCENLAYIGQFLPPKMWAQSECWFERRRHLSANCGWMVRDSAMVTMDRACRKPPSLFQMLPSLTPYDVPFPKMGVQVHPSEPTSWRVLPPGKYDRRYQQDFCNLHTMSPSAVVSVILLLRWISAVVNYVC